MDLISVKQYVAIKPIVHDKLETKVSGGIAVISQRKDVLKASLVMDYQDGSNTYYRGFDGVILTGDSGLKAWNRTILSIDGEEFVLCPFAEILGFVKGKK